MTDNMKKFLEAASKDEALKTELKALADGNPANEEAMKASETELAAKYGFTLTDDDFKLSEMTELTEDELRAAAGGICICPNFGGGIGTGKKCGCLVGGGGVNESGTPCICQGYGYGADD